MDQKIEVEKDVMASREMLKLGHGLSFVKLQTKDMDELMPLSH